MGKTEIRTKRWGSEGRSHLGSKMPSQSGVPAGKSEPIPDCCREQSLETLQKEAAAPDPQRSSRLHTSRQERLEGFSTLVPEETL